MTGSSRADRGRRYVPVLSFIVVLVVGVASVSVFLATGGSLFGWSGGVFGISERPALDATLRRARDAAWSGDYDVALAGFDSAADALPEDRALAVERARVLGWAQRYDEAADALAAVEDTADVETTLERARYLWWADRPRAADSLLSVLQRRHPSLDEARTLQELVRPSVDPDEDVARRWVDEQPDDPFARLWLARALVKAEKLAPALAHYRTAAGASGTVEPDVLLEAAGVALAVDSLQFASAVLLRYLHDVDPSDLETRLRLARAYSWAGRWAAAEEQYRQVLAATPDPDIRLELARMLENDGRHESAIAEYRRVLAARPSVAVRRSLAAALARVGSYDAAIREMDRVVGEAPDADLLLEHAELMALAERYGEAADVLGRVIELRSDAHDVRLRRARLLWWSGRLTEADDELTSLLARRPGDDEVLRLRDDVREGIDVSLDRARAWAQLDATPGNRLRLARMLTEQERHDEALPVYRATLADTVSRALVIEATDAAIAADSLDAATAILESFLAGDAADRELTLRLARLHGWAGRPAAAAEVFGRYLERFPADTGARYERARQLVWQDSTTWDSATVELQRVVEAEPHAGALKLLGDLAIWRGQPDEALAYYRDARALDPDREGLGDGIELARTMAESMGPAPDVTHVAWAAEVDAFTDSEGFDWVATDARRSWQLGRSTLDVNVGQRYSGGQTLAGAGGRSLGFRASLAGGYRFSRTITGSINAGITSYGDVGRFATWGARIELSDSAGMARLQYDREPAAREAATMAALQADAVMDRLLLRTVYGVGDWQAAGDLQLQAFSAAAGSTSRFAGTVRLDRPVGASGVTAGALVRGVFATEPAPSTPEWGPLLWAPVHYVAPALSVSYGTPVGRRWWVGLRASPGYAFIEERAVGVSRYRTGETATLEAGATVGFRTGPWSLSISGDWGGALPDGYRASTVRIELARIGGRP